MGLLMRTSLSAPEPRPEDLLGTHPANLLETLKGKRLALLGFEPPESETLRIAIDSAGAHMHTVTLDHGHPGLNTLAPFDACVVNLSSASARDASGSFDLFAMSRKPTVTIGDRDELIPQAFALASPTHEFIIRPWTPEDFYLRAFLILRSSSTREDIIETRPREAVVRALPTVVVVDDDRTTIMMVQSILRSWKINCVVARSGKEAIELTRKLIPDALLLDVSMPEMDGFQVLAALRADPATQAVPIVMLTAAHSESEIVRGFDLGADDYITKPFRPHEMVARIRRLVRTPDQS